MKRTTLALISILLLSALAGAILVNLAAANPLPYLPNIVIKSDGTVEPVTEFIKQDGNVYTLTADLPQSFSRPIEIQCSNIIFDGGGHMVNGSFTNPGRYQYFLGLRIENVFNVTVKDIEVTGCGIADISVENTINSVFLRVNASTFNLENSDGNTIAESTVLNDLSMFNSSNNTFMRNNFYSTLGSVSSTSNIFFENNFFTKYEGTGSAFVWDDGSVGNYWVDYVGLDENGDGIGDTSYVISSEAQDRLPLMNPWDPVVPYDTVAPRISIISPVHKVYNEASIPLTFVIYEASSSMSYSLDGQDNVTIAGNATLTELPNGSYNVTVYVTDQSGNIGLSDTIYFTVEVPEPFPTALVAAVSGTTAIATSLGLIIYFKKRNR